MRDEGDLDAFRRALAQNDLGHAVHHLAGIAARGRSAEADAAIAAFGQAASSAIDWVPLRDNVFVGEVVVRAVLLARARRWVDAVPLLLMAQAAQPEADYLAWIEEWLAEPECARSVTLDDVVSTAMRAAVHDALAPRVLALLDALRRAREPHGPLALTVARMLRTSGDVDGAIAVAEHEHGRAPSYFTSVARAAALRDAGRAGEAIAAYRDALGFDPDDLGARLDIGDLALEAGDLDGAAQAYAEVLEREDKHEWAWPSQMYIVAREGDDVGRAVLRALADGGNARARALYDRLEPWVLDLAPPAAALPELALAVRARGDAPAGTIEVSSLEPPSAVAACREILGDRPLDVTFGPTPGADPRLPRGPVAWALWTYDGDRARPALDPPRAAVAEAVSAIARTAYAAPRWIERARAAAKAMSDGDMRDVLATMLHPPAPGDATLPHVFRFRVQVAAAFVACRIGEEAPWIGSARASAMHALLDGPLDWTTTAAIVALAELAREVPSIAPAIAAELGQRLELPESAIAHRCLARPLAHALVRIGGGTAEAREALLDIRRQLDADP